MPKNENKSKHQEFLDVAEEIKTRKTHANLADHLRASLSPDEADAIINHAEWLKDYSEAQRAKAAKNENAGRKKLSDKDIKPESLKRRQQREEEKKSKEKKKEKTGD